MEGNVMFRWIILCIALAAVAAIFWVLRISNAIDGIAEIAFAVFMVGAFILLFLDRR